jgi:enterochelin esterase-like enzyme
VRRERLVVLDRLRDAGADDQQGSGRQRQQGECHSARAAREDGDDRTRGEPDRQPGERHPEQWLRVGPVELLERERAGRARTDVRDPGVPEQVQQADAGDWGDEAEDQDKRHVAEVHAVSRRLAVAVLAVAVFATGGYGTWSYAHNYYVYRGFPAVHDPPGIARGREVILKIWSKALHSERAVRVYLPPGYSSGALAGHRYPVLYLLQASVMQPTNYLKVGGLGPRVDTLVDAHRMPPYLSVMPAGNGRDHEWANAAAGNFDGYVMDVVHAIDKRFATIPNRRGRIVAGLSEGGYGAINVALHHLRTFAGFESWSGYYVQPGGYPFVGRFESRIPANSPALYVPRMTAQLRRLPLRAFMYMGDRERWPNIPDMLAFARELHADGGRIVDTAIYRGGHNWKLWRPHIPHMLVWAGQGFRWALRGYRA